MQKILNDPERFVDEMLEGIVAAHPDQVRLAASRVLVRADAPVRDKVAITTGGGSGHLPVFLGYVGEGLADGVAIGNVFASPSSDDMLEATMAVSGGRGVLYLYGNYGGDVLNFDLAAELADAEGIEVRTVLAADDVASAPPERADRRRGIAGIAFLYKIAGAAAAAGRSLDEVVAATESAAAGLRSMGVALSSCTIPAAGVPTFDLPAGEMEIGMGIHGEPGVRRGALEIGGSDRGRAVRRDPGRPPVPAWRRGERPGQRARSDAARGAVHPVPARRGQPRRRRDQHPPGVRRRVRDFARDGRRVGQPAAPRRRPEDAPRCAGVEPVLPAAVTSDGFDGAGLARLLAPILDDLDGRRDELNALDGVAGDGDLGLTVSLAGGAVRDMLPELAGVPIEEALRLIGRTIAKHAPSTSGTLVAFAFLAAAKVGPVAEDGAGRRRPLFPYLEAAGRSIAERGKVELGDRTMLDALGPAIAAYRGAAETGADASTAVHAAAEAATSGAAATEWMEAKVGRAGWLQDRARGHRDAGAALVATAFEAAAGSVDQADLPG